MGSLQSELQKLDTTTEEDGDMNMAPTDMDGKKKKRASPRAQRTKPAAVHQLIAEYGTSKTADMLGVTAGGLSLMITKDDVSLTLERLAHMIVHNEGKVVKVRTDRLIVCRVPHAEYDAVTRIIKALGGKTMDMGDV